MCSFFNYTLFATLSISSASSTLLLLDTGVTLIGFLPFFMQSMKYVISSAYPSAPERLLMDSEQDYIILDVRTPEEFAERHIEGAILIPDYEIGAKAESILTDKDQLILVYCRSGRRSKNAASELAALGYTNIKEFGGINDWNYGTVTE